MPPLRTHAILGFMKYLGYGMRVVMDKASEKISVVSKNTVLDDTVVSPLQVAMVQTSQTPGHALIKRAEVKIFKHEDRLA